MDKKIIKYFAMACFAVFAIEYVRSFMLIRNFNYAMPIIGIVLIITSLAVSKPILTTAGSAIIVLSRISLVMYYIKKFLHGSNFERIQYSLEILPVLAVLVLALVVINKKSAMIFGIISGIIMAIKGVLYVVNFFFYPRIVINCVVFLVGAVLLGYVFSEDKKVNIAVSERNVSTNKTDLDNNSIDKLLKLKEFLDSGIITQEEFDEKKKKLLNM